MSYTLVLEWMPGDLYMSAVTARCTAPTSSYSVVWLPPNKVYQITLYCGSTSLVSFLVGAFRGKAWSYMKNKIWYLGYIISLCIVLIIFLTDFNKMVDIGLAVLFSAIFSVSHTQILHNKMMKNDTEYKNNVMDERNIAIKEKAGNITNMITLTLLGLATVIFICLDLLLPAIVTGAIITVQPVILIIVSNMIEKKM